MIFSSKIKIGIVLALVTSLALLGWMYRAEVRKAASLAQQVITITEALRTTSEALKNERQERERAERLLRDREAERNRLRAESERLKRDLEELRHTDDDVRDWAATLVPDAIRLRKKPGGDTD